MSENEFMIPNENILFSIDNSGEKLSPIGWYEVILCRLKRHMKKKRGRNTVHQQKERSTTFVACEFIKM